MPKICPLRVPRNLCLSYLLKLSRSLHTLVPRCDFIISHVFPSIPRISLTITLIPIKNDTKLK